MRSQELISVKTLIIGEESFPHGKCRYPEADKVAEAKLGGSEGMLLRIFFFNMSNWRKSRVSQCVLVHKFRGLIIV